MGIFDKKKKPSGEAAPQNGVHEKNDASLQGNPEFQKIAPWLMSVKFRRKAVGGLDEADVWKKIDELNAMYEKALVAERVRCNLLIAQVRRLSVEKQKKVENTPEGDSNA